jgi:hypothetical protein
MNLSLDTFSYELGVILCPVAIVLSAQVQKPLAVLRAEHAGQHAARSASGGLMGGEEEGEMRDEEVLDAIMAYQVRPSELF